MRVFGEYVGRRYKDKPVIWIVGGDRPIETDDHRRIMGAMAEALRAGDGCAHLITMRTWGPPSTSKHVHDKPWLDYHTGQSGHARNSANGRFNAEYYAHAPSDGRRTGLKTGRQHPQSGRRLSR